MASLVSEGKNNDSSFRVKQMWRAVSNGDLGCLKSVFEKDLANERIGQQRDSLLHCASERGHLEIVKYLIEEIELDLDIINCDGKTALHCAAQSDNVECVSYLLKKGAQVDCIKRSNWTPLMLATARNTNEATEIVTLLLKAGARCDVCNKDGWNAVMLASRAGNVNTLKAIQQIYPNLWTFCTKRKRTPVHTAARHGCVDALQYLFEWGNFEPSAKDSNDQTPLMDAAMGGSVDAVKFLEGQGASILDTDITGRCALHYAAEMGHFEVLELLLQQDVSANIQDNMKNTPLHYAAKGDYINAVELLLNFGADFNMKNDNGQTPCDVAASRNLATKLKPLAPSCI